MKFTLGWLKEHLETDASLEDIVEKLTALGLEVEKVEDKSAVFEPFRVAYVESAEKHPNADRLKVCMVNTGKEVVQVVCGAPNARAGMKGIFAPAGSYIPGLDTKLKKGVIRGVESNGMLVSEKEMGISDDHGSIIDLDGDFEVGTSFCEVFGVDDPVIEIDLTPDRPDCAGVRGIARDLAAAGLGRLKPLDITPVEGSFESPVSVETLIPDVCPVFVGRYIKGVKNVQSPEWMQKRLKAVGLRPISALVDISNYLSLDICRPLHMFDADRLSGGIHVRFAKVGEELEALDDKTYKIGQELADSVIGICDDAGLQGLGGIIGGVATACGDDTVNVFIESAYFDPMTIARSGRRLQAESDARYRFERGVDPESVLWGMEVATRFVLEICGGEASEIVVAGEVPEWKKRIELPLSFVEKLSGIAVEEGEQVRILEDLGFLCERSDDGRSLFVTPPSWRPDVDGKADLVEEIARVYGYDKIPTLSVISRDCITKPAETLNLSRLRKSRRALAARGMEECVTYSFISKRSARLFCRDYKEGELVLSNPISSEMNSMRPSILPNLMEAAGRNAARGFANNALFETGPVFNGAKPDEQPYVVCGVRSNSVGDRHWADPLASRVVDAIDVKADVLRVLEAVGVAERNVRVERAAPDYYHPGKSGVMKMGKFILASFGEIHPAVVEEMGLEGVFCGFEVFLNNIPKPKNKGHAKKALKLSPLQPVERDFAFVVDEGLESAELVRAAMAADKGLIERVDVFDVYQGKGVDEGKKSVAINVVLQPDTKTLTDSDIEAVSKKIVANVAEKTGGVLRG